MGNLAPLKDQLLETEKWLLDELRFRIYELQLLAQGYGRILR
jgi:hypothetical protein